MTTRGTTAGAVKACPYCGGKATLDPMPGSRGWWRVRCRHYECGGTTWAMDEADKAVEAWNRRAPHGKE